VGTEPTTGWPIRPSPDPLNRADNHPILMRTEAPLMDASPPTRPRHECHRQVGRAQQEATLEKFMVAISSGDLQGLLELAAPDVVMIADGGGLVSAARKPMTGIERVAAFLARLVELPDLVATTAWSNGMPGIRFDIDGETTAVSLVVEGGRIFRIYAIRNPQKLGWLGKVAELQR
jgi:hypothetical protein